MTATPQTLRIAGAPRGERRAARLRLLATTVLSSTIACAAAAPALAKPRGGSVAAGQASIVDAGKTTTIKQTSGKAILNWQGFSIANDEAVYFQQPGRDAIALNRVTGDEPSSLLGTLTANGNVWLVNPNGVFIGPSATISAGGFLATTADILDADFLGGRYAFTRPSPVVGASVVNEGLISVADTGLAALVAPDVRNDGIIAGRLGAVVLAGTPTFTLDLQGDGLIQFAVGDEAAAQLAEGHGRIDMDGRITVDGGDVLLTAAAAAGIVDDVINVGGVIEARSVAERDGVIVLAGGDGGSVRLGGRLDASGAEAGTTGGRIDLLGARVIVEDGAVADASGAAGGGSLRIGGDERGGGEVRTAAVAAVGEGATLRADATEAGDGGRVIVWAEEYADVRGQLSARGGPGGGDGGFIETSSPGGMWLTPDIDTQAPAGTAGLWLIDPTDVQIVAATDDAGSVRNPPVFAADPDPAGGGPVLVLASVLDSAAAPVTIEASRDIDVLSALSMTTDLTLDAGRTLTLAQPVVTTGTVTLAGTTIREVDQGRITAGRLDLEAAAAGSIAALTGANAIGALSAGAAGGGAGFAQIDVFNTEALILLAAPGGTTRADRLSITAGDAITVAGNIAAGTRMSLSAEATAAGKSRIEVVAGLDVEAAGGRLLMSASEITQGDAGRIRADFVEVRNPTPDAAGTRVALKVGDGSAAAATHEIGAFGSERFDEVALSTATDLTLGTTDLGIEGGRVDIAARGMLTVVRAIDAGESLNLTAVSPGGGEIGSILVTANIGVAAADGTVRLTGGRIAQSEIAFIAAPTLILATGSAEAAGTEAVLNGANLVGAIASDDGAGAAFEEFSYRNAAPLVVGTGGLGLAGGRIALTADEAITVAAPVTAAERIDLRATLAASSDIAIDAPVSVTAADGIVTLAAQSITQGGDGRVAAGGGLRLTPLGDGGIADLGGDNAVGVLAAGGGADDDDTFAAITLHNIGDLAIGSVDGVAGVVADRLAVTVDEGALTVAAAIEAAAAVELASIIADGGDGGSPFAASVGGPVRLAAPITVSDDGGSVLLAGGAIAQEAAATITASALGVVAMAPVDGVASVSLDAANAVDAFTFKPVDAATTTIGALSFGNRQDLAIVDGAIGSVDFSGQPARADAMRLVVDGEIVIGKALEGAGSGTTILINAESLDNGALGDQGLQPDVADPGGRFLVYTDDPRQDRRNVSADRFDKRYDFPFDAANAVDGIPAGRSLPADGNFFLYGVQPTLTLRIDDASRPAGQPNPAFTFQGNGLIDGDALADALAGDPAGLQLTTAADGSSGPGTYPITFVSPPEASELGYAIDVRGGTLTVTGAAPAPAPDVLPELQDAIEIVQGEVSQPEEVLNDQAEAARAAVAQPQTQVLGSSFTERRQISPIPRQRAERLGNQLFANGGNRALWAP